MFANAAWHGNAGEIDLSPHSTPEAKAAALVVVDLGKTLAKASLWSADGVCLDRQARPNARVVHDGIARLDAVGIAGWLEQVLAGWADRNIGAIVPVGHGAAAAALVDDALAFAPFDYEAARSEERRVGKEC